MDNYPTQYSDIRGAETTTIFNDSATLRISLRGVVFSGSDFDSLEPAIDTAPALLEQFSLHHGALCSCRLECQIPVPIRCFAEEVKGILLIELILGDPKGTGGLKEEKLRTILKYKDMQFSSSGRSGWFEDELLEIQSQLPTDVYIKSCINCLYSDYSPLGHGLFGSMFCFRNLKSEYLKVKTKHDFWSVSGRQDRFVQETYLCPEFARRIPGTGYRG